VITLARTPQDPQLRITEILDAAESLFNAKGYHETAISDIAKKMRVAQGTLYYYFKSKEELLEALINRQVSSFISEIKNIAFSDTMTPPNKIELMFHVIFLTIHYKEGLLFDFLYDDQYLHILDKLARQTKLLLAPSLLKIIEEGAHKQYFQVSHPKAALDFILSIMQCLIDVLYEKTPAELLSQHSNMAEALIEKALGLPQETIHISL
jgi:AcrR family transcriptional regulator